MASSSLPVSAESAGKDRTTVANMLRVLQLPENVRKLLEEGQLTLGHAKVLLGVDDPARVARLAKEIVSDGLTVRELEQRLRGQTTPSAKKRGGRPRKNDQRPEIRRVEDRLRRFLQTDISITIGKNDRGSLAIQFYSLDDLQRVLEIVRVPE